MEQSEKFFPHRLSITNETDAKLNKFDEENCRIDLRIKISLAKINKTVLLYKTQL